LIGWRSEFFLCGHSMEAIDDLSYWDFIDLTQYSNNQKQASSGRKTTTKLSKTQQGMIDARKEKESLRKRKQGKK